MDLLTSEIDKVDAALNGILFDHGATITSQVVIDWLKANCKTGFETAFGDEIYSRGYI